MERESTTIDILLNKVSLLEKTLEYYANIKMYSGNIEKINILKDKGHQARFALEQIKKIDNYEDNYEDDMVKNLRELLENDNNISDEEMTKALNDMVKISGSIDKLK